MCVVEELSNKELKELKELKTIGDEEMSAQLLNYTHTQLHK